MRTGLTAFRRVLLAWIAGTIVGAGCAAPESSDTRHALAVEQRREQLRERLVASLGDRYDEPLADASIDQIRGGSALYDLLCRSCHGPTGRGNGRSARMLLVPPPDLADPATASFFSDQAKLKIIADGVEGSPMIGWGRMLSEEERISVLQFMNTLVREPRVP